MECVLDGDVVQRTQTSEMIFGVANLVLRLSLVCGIFPGDLIFTGTPGGVEPTDAAAFRAAGRDLGQPDRSTNIGWSHDVEEVVATHCPVKLNSSRQERTRIRSSSCHIPPGMVRWLDSSIRAASTVAASPVSTAR
jgi:hypothetical protein